MVRHTGFKAVSTGRGYATLSNYWLRPWRKLVADLIRNPEVQGRGGRHTGFKAVSTERGYATLSNYWLRPWRKLVADLIRNPEVRGGAGQTTRQHNQQNPLSLDGRGIKEPVPVPDTGIRG